MKIAFYSGENSKKHASRLIELLTSHAPEHEYNHCALADRADQSDLWHYTKPNSLFLFGGRVHRSVINIWDLRFVDSPELFSLYERLLVLPLCRYHCRHAARLIAHNSDVKRSLVEQLGVAQERVEICMPLFAMMHDDLEYIPTPDELLECRERFDLPQTYILIVGEIDTMHGHTTILHAIFEQPQELSVIIYGRRTTHSDTLLEVVRDHGAAGRVTFIYECGQQDLNAIYRMAMVVIYMPSFASSIKPIVEAICQRVPMILSDTPLNREAAGAAALFVRAYDVEALGAAIKSVIYNESFRGQLLALSAVEARRYSAKGVAEQLARIYESV